MHNTTVPDLVPPDSGAPVGKTLAFSPYIFVLTTAVLPAHVRQSFSCCVILFLARPADGQIT